MAVHDVETEWLCYARDGVCAGDIAEAGHASDRQAMDAERTLRIEPGESGIGLRAARGRIAHDADCVTKRRLDAHEVADMAEQSADRRAEDMQDVQAFVQNQRSRI
jgi:hypothetical protein